MTGPKPLPQRTPTLAHERAPESTARQRELYDAVTGSASNVTEQLLLLTVQAARVGASERDVASVRARLLEPFERECKG